MVNWLGVAENGPMLALAVVVFWRVVESVKLLPVLTFPNAIPPVNDTPADNG
jgi:hypothetical protein